MMQLTFLGTSAGVPTKHRNVTGLCVECINTFGSTKSQNNKKNKPWVLVDCGEATQHQLLKTKISSRQLAVICITHVHGDHCYGLPGLLASMSMSGRKETLTIIAPQAIEHYLDAVKQTTQLYLPFSIEFIAIEDLLENNCEQNSKNLNFEQPCSVKFEFSNSHQLNIEVIKLSHRVDSYAFKLSQNIQKIKLDVDKLKADGVEPSNLWGDIQAGKNVVLQNGNKLKSIDYTKRIKQQLNIVIAGDNDKPELLKEAVNDAILLVHEATYTQAVADKLLSRKNGFDPMHTSSMKIAKFAESVPLSNLILTHFSARYQPYDDPESKTPNMSDIRIEVENLYNGNFWLARDFTQFEITINGVRQFIN